MALPELFAMPAASFQVIFFREVETNPRTNNTRQLFFCAGFYASYNLLLWKRRLNFWTFWHFSVSLLFLLKKKGSNILFLWHRISDLRTCRRCPQLTSLNLSRCAVGDETAKEIANILPKVRVLNGQRPFLKRSTLKSPFWWFWWWQQPFRFEVKTF